MITNWYKPNNPTSEEVEIFARDPWVPINSSFIEALAYHELARVLEIKLKSGRRYTFMDVPKNIYEAFLASPSKGTFFNTIVKQNYTKS